MRTTKAAVLLGVALAWTPLSQANDPTGSARARELVERWREGRFDPPPPPETEGHRHTADCGHDHPGASAPPRLTRDRALAELAELGGAAEPALLTSWRRLAPEDAQLALSMLTTLGTPGAFRAFLEAAQSDVPAHRQAAVACLPEFAADAARRPRVLELLYQALDDGDAQTAQGALASLYGLEAPESWEPLERRFVAELEQTLLGLSDEGQAQRLDLMVRTLGRVLPAVATPARIQGLLELGGRLVTMGEPEATQPVARRTIEVLAAAETPLVGPYLRGLLYAEYVPDPEERPEQLSAGVALEGVDPFELEISVDAALLQADALLPLSAGQKVAALRALGRARHADDRELCQLALGDRDPSVRLAALSQLGLLVPTDVDERFDLLERVIGLLRDPHRSVASAAHSWLKINAAEAKLPFSYRAWARWAPEARTLARARAIVLADLAEEGAQGVDLDEHLLAAGYESIEEYVGELGYDTVAAFVAERWEQLDEAE